MMADTGKTREQLLIELAHLRQRIEDLEAVEKESTRTEADLAWEALLHSSQLRSSTDIAIATADTDLRITSWSAMAENLFGYTSEEAIGRSVMEMHTRESVAPERFEQAVETVRVGREYRYTITQDREDGRRILESRVVGIRDMEGEAVGFCLYIRDVTDRKQLEEDIQHRSAFLEKVIESLPHPFCVIDSDTYRIRLANSAAGGHALSEDTTCYALTHRLTEPCSGREHPCPLRLATETKKPAVVDHVHLDGEANARDVEVHACPILDGDGEVKQVIEYALDVTERNRAQKALRDSEEWHRLLARRWQTTFDAITDMIAVVSLNFELTDVNEAMCRATGMRREDLIGKKCYTIVHGTDAPIEDCPCARAHSTQRSSTLEYMKDGRSLRASAWPILGENGEVEALAHTVKDVTERKRAEEELAREHVLRDAEYAVRVAVASMDRPDHLCRVVEEIGTQLRRVGVAHDSCTIQVVNPVGTDFVSFASYIHEEWYDEIMAFIATGKRDAARSHAEEYPWVTEVWRSGEPRYVGRTEISGEGAVFSDVSLIDVPFSQGTLAINKSQPDAFGDEDIAVVQRFARVLSDGFQRFLDITERREAERSLRESERRYQDLYDNAPDMYASVDPLTSAITECNQTLADVLGCSRDEVMRGTVCDLYTPESATYVRERVLPELMQRGSVEGELQLRRKDGSAVDVLLRATGICDSDGNALHARWSWRDISVRKRMEEAQRESERLRVLMETASGAAHEINQPLQVITGQLQMVLMELEANDPKREKLERAFGETARVTTILSKMRNVQKYATSPYPGGTRILDLDAASRADDEG